MWGNKYWKVTVVTLSVRLYGIATECSLYPADSHVHYINCRTLHFFLGYCIQYVRCSMYMYTATINNQYTQNHFLHLLTLHSWMRRNCVRCLASLGHWQASRWCGPGQKRREPKTGTAALWPSWRERTQRKPSHISKVRRDVITHPVQLHYTRPQNVTDFSFNLLM